VGGLLGGFGPRVPFFAAAVFTAINFLIAVVVLKETLPESQRRAFSARRANVLGAIKSMRAIPGAALLLFVLFMYQIGHDTLPSTWTWMTMAKFGWGEREMGISLAVLGLGTAVVQGGLVGIFTRKLGEFRSALIGLSAGSVGFMGYALSTEPWMLFASVPVACLIGLTMPSIRAILSRQVPANAQGELQGAIAGIVSFTALVTPFTMTHLFSFSMEQMQFPGAPFVAAAASLVLGTVLLTRSRFSGGHAPR
jgi:DHA1 family tetracycline resistance protein-like MFS transporter